MDITRRLYMIVILLVFTIGGIAIFESIQSKKADNVTIASVLRKARSKVNQMEVTDVLTPVGEKQGHKFNVPQDVSDKKQKPRTFTKQDALQIPQAPKGFSAELTNNYLILREKLSITPELTNFINNIHGNLVLDIIPFSLYSDFKRLLLMLFRTRENFTKYTNRPEWSQAATDIKTQSIYLMEGYSFKPIFIHELTHIYFDGFFLPSAPPLWLSEGYAVYNQSKAQNRAENEWLTTNMLVLSQKNYINFTEFNATTALEDYTPQEVELWYSQAYSVVKYLIEKDKDSFYQFSKNLKESMPIGMALYRAYGMPLNSLKALEYAWQAQLQKEVRGIR